MVGYAPSVFSDVEAARRLRPDAVLLGVKYSCVLFPEIAHVWTQHLEQAADIKARAGRLIYVHSRPKQIQRKTSTYIFGKTESFVDYIWPELSWVGASSGIAAAQWARHGMGFDEVILCGVTLEHGGYASGVAQFKALRGEKGASFVDNVALMNWREQVAGFLKRGQMAGIVSMSGWTRDALGAPC